MLVRLVSIGALEGLALPRDKGVFVIGRILAAPFSTVTTEGSTLPES